MKSTKIIKLTSDECFLATPLIMCLVIQGKKKEAKELAKRFQTPTGVNLMYDYKRAIESIKKNNLKFSKDEKEKQLEYEKEIKKKLKIE